MLDSNQDASKNSLRVLLVDDHRIILDTVQIALSIQMDAEVHTVDNLSQAITSVEDGGRYDTILLDYSLPGVNGLEGLREVLKVNNGGVALFSGNVSWPIITSAVEHGASGYIPKTSPIKTLINAIRFIADGEVYLPYEFMMQRANGESDQSSLKARERHVLAFLCEGLQNKEISREVGIDEVIVKMDVKSICRKLGVRNRTEAAIAARKLGLY
jgi:two-component system, NarL family, nitrate/nitrite response regulator NarL